MNCIKCGNKTIVAKTDTFHHAGDKYPMQRRLYVCTHEPCSHSFYYKNTFLSNHEAFNVRRFMETYERNKTNPDLFEED